MAKNTVMIQNYLRQKALGISGLIMSDQDPRIRAERLTYVNNINEIIQNKLRAYNIWYAGDSDELLNFYTRMNNIDYNIDPLYNRNNKSYFWAVCSTENDIKRSHSGQPKNIVDTLVAILGDPHISVGAGEGSVLGKVDKLLQDILYENSFFSTLKQKARPLTLVEGWGAWKINWDKSISDNPILIYYRADSVDFFYRSNRLVAICYRDFYQDAKGHNYVLFEMRRQENKSLVIEKELFRIGGGSSNVDEILIPCKLEELPQLKDIIPSIKIDNYRGFLGAPCIYFKDNQDDMPGRSIFTGKLDLFDDLDQCYSQSANAVRRSTVVEYFNNMYLERDKQGMPIMPHAFDRKYVQYKGMPTGDGGSNSNISPVTVTQPHIDFAQYSQEETNILLNIISGLMSPATLGIDIAKKDNADAQREKEKVTIFTRNLVIAEEERTLKTIMNDLLCAKELMDKNEITVHEYDISIKYDEFADASFEAKLESVLTGWEGGIFSDEMAIEMLWGDTLGTEKAKRELEHLKSLREQQNQMPGGMMPDEEGGLNPEDMGEFGQLGAENDWNDAHNKQSMQEQLGIPDLDESNSK